MFNDIMGTVFIMLLIIGIIFLIFGGIIVFGLVFLIKGIIDLIKEHKGKVDATKYKGGKLYTLIGGISITVGIILIRLTWWLLSYEDFLNEFGKFINRLL